MDMRFSAPDPPGAHIKEELEARGWQQRDLAFVLGMREEQLSRILSGKQAITPDLARQLGEAFDVPAEFFVNLQKQYDLWRAKEPDPAIRTRATLQSLYPVREMIRRGWIDDSDASLLELQIERFLEVDSLDNAPQYHMAAKRPDNRADSSGQVVWLFRVRQLARQLEAPCYCEEKLRSLVPQLRPFLIEPNAVREVPSLLLNCGVRLVVVEWLPGTKIDGVCTWLDSDKPVIGMSTLHDRLDNFWFVLRHEIEHVLRGDGKAVPVFDNLDEPVGIQESVFDDAERIANEAAADFCVPRDKMLSFYQRKQPFISERDVLAFASLVGVHPAIVVGQLQHMMKRHNYLRKYQVPVRKHILEAAFSDGFGSVAPVSL